MAITDGKLKAGRFRAGNWFLRPNAEYYWIVWTKRWHRKRIFKSNLILMVLKNAASTSEHPTDSPIPSDQVVVTSHQQFQSWKFYIRLNRDGVAASGVGFVVGEGLPGLRLTLAVSGAHC
jgi:hypothetical protein